VRDPYNVDAPPLFASNVSVAHAKNVNYSYLFIFNEMESVAFANNLHAVWKLSVVQPFALVENQHGARSGVMIASR